MSSATQIASVQMTAVPVDGPAEQLVERLPLGGIQCAQHLVLGAGQGAFGLAEAFRPVFGEFDDVSAAILG